MTDKRLLYFGEEPEPYYYNTEKGYKGVALKYEVRCIVLEILQEAELIEIGIEQSNDGS